MSTTKARAKKSPPKKPATKKSPPKKPAANKPKPAKRAPTKKTKAKASLAPKTSVDPSADANLQKVRALCLALPDTKMTITWGSPYFRVGDKIFCGFGSDDSKQVVGFKLEHNHARSIVKEARFWPAPYVGKHGWVSMDVTQRKSWDEVAALIRESYELIAPKTSRAKLR